MIKHKHHIIPRHAGGDDSPENLIELTIEEHALAHKILWEKHNRWQDFIAWKTLSGAMSAAEATKLAQKNADKTWVKTDWGKQRLKDRWKTRRERGNDVPWNKGLTKNDHPSIMKASEVNLNLRKEGKLANIGDLMKGASFSEEHKQKLSQRAKNRKKVLCTHCEKEFPPGMFSRWHGDKCKKIKDE